MAKKKKATSKKKGGGKKSKKGMGDFVDVQKLLGMGGAAFVNGKLIPKIPGTANLNPKILAAGKILGGQFIGSSQTTKNFLSNDSMRNGLGDGIIYEGVKELMAGFGIAGVGQDAINRKPKGNEFLAVSIEGLEDAGAVSEDILSADEYDIGEDDLSTVNEDILGEEMGEDMGEDIGEDDLSTVNEDILGEEMGEDI